MEQSEASKHNSLGLHYRKAGNYQLAEAHYREAIRLKGNFAEAYNNLASLFYKQNRILEAIPLYEKALRLHPEYFAAHFNLANCFTLENRPLQAIIHYQEALKLQPQNKEVMQNLAMCYIATNQLELALPLLEIAVKHNPLHPELALELAKTYLDLGKTKEAISAYNTAKNLNPNEASIYHNLAILYLRENNQQLAIENFQYALKINPQNTIAQHMLNSLLGENSNTAPAPHVEALFNQYATNYDEHMRNKLNYKVPELLRSTFAKYIQPNEKTKNIIDLGCGTGQCGIYFRDVANFMLGIDLSYHMLLLAKAQGTYDKLCQANINSFIPGMNKDFFDLAIAGDILVYLGDLNPFFLNCAALLKKDSKLLFTTENSTSKDYILCTSGRFAHSTSYIEQLAIKYGFMVEEIKHIIPRENNGQPIEGNLYVLSKI